MYLERPKLQSILQCSRCYQALSWRDNFAQCRQCDTEVFAEDKAFIFNAKVLPENYKTPDYCSSNPYHTDCLELIEQHQSGIVLNYGAGNPKFSFNHVVELEIRQYASTDLVCADIHLPLKNDSIDGVISLSVLEHVKDPFHHVKEIYRVLKPGGTCVLHAAFMQPFHAYPDHYFNTTKAALTHLFEDFRIEDLKVGDHQHPWIMLNWVLNTYLQGLPEKHRESIKQLTIGDLLDLMNKNANRRNEIKALDDAYQIADLLGHFNDNQALDMASLLSLNADTTEHLAAGFCIKVIK